MKNESLFEFRDIYAEQNPCKSYSRDGKLSETLDELKKGKRRVSDYDRYNTIYRVGDIIRASLSFKENGGIQSNIPEFIETTTQYALNICRNPRERKKIVKKFENEMIETCNSKLFNQWINYNIGDSNVEYWTNNNCLRSAGALVEKTKNKNILMIPIADGGIVPGLKVFLKYIKLSESNDSKIYPLRYSTRKNPRDTTRVESSELNYLLKMGRNRDIVIFDDDSYSGRTILGLKHLLQREIFGDKNILLKVNGNMTSKFKMTRNARKNLNPEELCELDRLDESHIKSLDEIF